MTQALPESSKRPLRRIEWIAAVVLLVLTAILAAPFLLTTQLVRLALRQIFPVNSPTVGSAALSPSGTLVVRDLVLHDTAGLAQQPLITAREVDAAFGWTELLARQLRRIRIEGVTVYARRKGPSQISLLDLIPRESKPRAKPLWIGTLEIRGAVHSEPIAGFARTETDWPLSFQMITSGGPAGSRQFKVAIGDARRLGGNASKPSDTEPRPNAEGGFGMMAEFEAQAAAGGTRVTMRRLEASKAVVLIASDTLRHFVAKLPPELHGDVEASLGKLSASGELNPQPSTNARRIAGRLAFSGFRLRVPDSPQMMLSLEDVAGSARIDTLLPPGPGTSIRIERLQVGKSAASIEADVLRRYVAALPPDLHGRIDGDFAALEVSGHILSGTGGGMRFSGNVRLQDLAVRSPPDGKHAFTLDRLTTEGIIESRLDRWAPGTLKLRDGITRWAALTYGNNVLNNFDAAWRIDGQTLSIDRCETRIFGGRISGSPVLDLATHAMPPGDFQIKSIDMHEVLANLSPERIDAEGAVSGVVHLAASKMG